MAVDGFVWFALITVIGVYLFGEDPELIWQPPTEAENQTRSHLLNTNNNNNNNNGKLLNQKDFRKKKLENNMPEQISQEEYDRIMKGGPIGNWKPKDGASYLETHTWTHEQIRNKRPDLADLDLRQIPQWMIRQSLSRDQILAQLEEREKQMQREQLREQLMKGLLMERI